MSPMNRREAIRATTTLLGGALFASSGVLAACAREESGEETRGVLSAEDQALAVEIADTILPTTAESPGAKAAGVGAIMNLLLSDCEEAATQRRVVAGLADFRAARAGFASLPRAERERVLLALDAEAQAAAGPHWYAIVRELALRSYFSSEVGLTQALRYNPVPGRWEGCVPLRPGQRAWA